ncbi:hypothetical protein [Bacillus luti]|uniref:hypothetical protein n=1 Tax=Bacillus luti TaxID=2026191 RepID=UPI0012E74AF8|nr:hypothetical protein [Bacillus luti]
MKKVDLDSIEETNVIETKQEGSFTPEIRSPFKEEVPVEAPVEEVKKKGRGPRGPKPKKKGVVKSFNLDPKVAERLEKEVESQEDNASVFVEKILRKHFNMEK